MGKERIATVSAFSAESPVGSRGEVAESCARSDKPRLLAASKAPRNDKVIKVIEYVHTADGELVRVDQLGPEQYEQFRRWLGCTYLNELYRGRAEFYYPETAGDGLRFCGETTGAHFAPLRPETAGGHNG